MITFHEKKTLIGRTGGVGGGGGGGSRLFFS